MPRTPDRRPGKQIEDDYVEFQDRGTSPGVVGSIYRKTNSLFAQDAIGEFNLRQGAGGSDEDVKVSSNDTTAGKLSDKLVEGSGVTLTELNDGGDEDLEISAVGALCHLIITTWGGVVYDTAGEIIRKENP